MTADYQKTKSWTKRKKIILYSLAVIFIIGGWWGWQEGRPWVKSIQAYIYAFPLIVMDVTREVSTSVATSGEFKAPMNQFSVMTKYPDASFRLVPRTGLDTQFAVAWADLNEEPLVLSVPNTQGRYYVIALFDMWSNVFASIGSRTTGTDATNFLISGPTWKGQVPAGMEVYKSPTRNIWVNGQMLSNGEIDYEVVNTLQKQYKLTPLSLWGQPYEPPTTVTVNASIDTKTLVLDQIKNMDTNEFFGRFARLMKYNPPTSEDAKMVEKLKSLGIEPGDSFALETLKPNIVRALNRAMSTFGLLEKGVKKLETKDGWIVIPANFANYGTDYLTRAGIALIGLGGILPQDILYPTAFNDINDKPLDASKKYVIHFDKGKLPPAKATWSVSMYDAEGYYVANSINRYHLSASMPMKYNANGSLDIYIQFDSPGEENKSNWLPSPKEGTFSLTTRIFWPEEAALNGTWSMPGIQNVE